MTSMTDVSVEHDRRRAPRVPCTVALRYETLSETQFVEAIESFDRRRQRLYLLDVLTQPSEEDVDRFLAISKNHPEIAEHLQSFAAKFDAVARLLMEEPEHLSNRPTHKATISATGMQFFTPVPFRAGNVLELQLRLAPGQPRILVLAEVVSSTEKEDGPANYATAVSFNYLNETDKDQLIGFVEGILKQET